MRKALHWFLLSLCVLSLLGAGAWTFWQYKVKVGMQDPRYLIRRIVQTGGELKSDYLAELVSISSDRPTSLYAFDCKEAVQKLLASPLIREARVKREFPDAIYIDYEVRKPLVRIADYGNVAMDQEHYLFPLTPFFSPKEIPSLYLGLPPFGFPKDSYGRCGGRWHEPLDNLFLQLALDILTFLEVTHLREGVRIKCIDVSNAFAPTLGQREIVLQTEEELLLPDGGVAVFPKLLRLSPKDYPQQLSSFFLLRRRMETDYRKQLAHLSGPTRFAPRIIDLRIPHLAFVENQ